jgi:hypothetical protein
MRQHLLARKVNPPMITEQKFAALTVRLWRLYQRLDRQSTRLGDISVENAQKERLPIARVKLARRAHFALQNTSAKIHAVLQELQPPLFL